MMKKRIYKVIGVVAVAALAGVAGATYAGSRPAQDKPPGAGPAAIAANLRSETKFVPVTPCRAVDTRLAGGKMNAGTNRGFDMFGTNLSGQGGNAAGCAIPDFASGVSINITSVEPGGTGYLRGTAQNLAILPVPTPTATLLSFAAGPPRGNEVPLGVCRSGIFVCSGGDEIRLFVYNASTHVVVDVLGYFVEPVFATVDGDDATDPEIFRSSGVTSVTRTQAGNWTVVPTRDIRGCAVLVSSGASDDGQIPDRDVIMSFEFFGAADLRVYAQDDAGTPVDSEWTLYAHC